MHSRLRTENCCHLAASYDALKISSPKEFNDSCFLVCLCPNRTGAECRVQREQQDVTCYEFRNLPFPLRDFYSIPCRGGRGLSSFGVEVCCRAGYGDEWDYRCRCRIPDVHEWRSRNLWSCSSTIQLGTIFRLSSSEARYDSL